MVTSFLHALHVLAASQWYPHSASRGTGAGTRAAFSRSFARGEQQQEEKAKPITSAVQRWVTRARTVTLSHGTLPAHGTGSGNQFSRDRWPPELLRLWAWP